MDESPDLIGGYYNPTEEEKARQRRQQAIYNVQMFAKNGDLGPEEVIEAAKRMLKFIETGE